MSDFLYFDLKVILMLFLLVWIWVFLCCWVWGWAVGKMNLMFWYCVWNLFIFLWLLLFLWSFWLNFVGCGWCVFVIWLFCGVFEGLCYGYLFGSLLIWFVWLRKKCWKYVFVFLMWLSRCFMSVVFCRFCWLMWLRLLKLCVVLFIGILRIRVICLMLCVNVCVCLWKWCWKKMLVCRWKICWVSFCVVVFMCWLWWWLMSVVGVCLILFLINVNLLMCMILFWFVSVNVMLMDYCGWSRFCLMWWYVVSFWLCLIFVWFVWWCMLFLVVCWWIGFFFLIVLIWLRMVSVFWWFCFMCLRLYCCCRRCSWINKFWNLGGF